MVAAVRSARRSGIGLSIAPQIRQDILQARPPKPGIAPAEDATFVEADATAIACAFRSGMEFVWCFRPDALTPDLPEKPASRFPHRSCLLEAARPVHLRPSGRPSHCLVSPIGS
jgi:hypothetical protein